MTTMIVTEATNLTETASVEMILMMTAVALHPAVMTEDGAMTDMPPTTAQAGETEIAIGIGMTVDDTMIVTAEIEIETEETAIEVTVTEIGIGTEVVGEIGAEIEVTRRKVALMSMILASMLNKLRSIIRVLSRLWISWRGCTSIRVVEGSEWF